MHCTRPAPPAPAPLQHSPLTSATVCSTGAVPLRSALKPNRRDLGRVPHWGGGGGGCAGLSVRVGPCPTPSPPFPPGPHALACSPLRNVAPWPVQAQQVQFRKLFHPLWPEVHALLQSPVSDGDGQRVGFQVPIGARLRRMLQDHRVEGAMVWPAAAYIEMACAVQRRLFGGHEDRGLRDLRFTRKLVVSEGGTEAADVVRCVFEDGHFRITRDDEVHAVGRRAEDVEGIGNAKEWMAAAEVRCTRRADIEGLQRTLREGGFCYGAQFRTLKHAYVGEGEAVGVLEAPDDAGDYGLHPGLIDGAFQLTDLICRGGVPARAEYVAAPSRRRGSGPVRAYVKVVACDVTSSCCDVTLLDPEHNVLLRVGALWQVWHSDTPEGARAASSSSTDDTRDDSWPNARAAPDLPRAHGAPSAPATRPAALRPAIASPTHGPGHTSGLLPEVLRIVSCTVASPCERDAGFVDAGLDSLDLLRLRQALGRAFAVQVPMDVLTAASPASLCAFLEAAQGGAPGV